MSGGSKKKTTVGYNYFLGFHLIFCHGPVDSFIRFIADEKTAWEGFNNGTTGGQVIFSPFLFGGEDKEGGLAGAFDVLFGGPTQGLNAYLTSQLPGELIPNFRGLFSMIAKQVYVGTSTYLKPMGVRASRIHVRTSDGIEQWYDEKAEIGLSSSAYEPTLISNTTRGPPGNTYKLSMMYTDGTFLWIFEDLSELYTDGSVNVYKRTLDGLAESLVGSFTATYNGTCIDGWADVPTYVTANDTGMLSVQHYDGTTLSLESYDVSALSSNAAGLGNQTASYYQRGGEKYYLVDDYTGVSTDVVIYDLSTGAPVAAFTSTSSDTHGQVVEMFPGDTLNYVITDALVLVAYNKAWVEQWFVDLSSTPIVVTHGVGGANVVIREESDGQVMIAQDSLFIRVSAGGFTNYGLLSGTSGGIPGYEGHGGQVLVDDVMYSLDAVTNTVAAVRLSSTSSGADMNPAHIIRECLTDPDWGMGYQDADIDNTSFTAAADKLYDEAMGISLLWNKQTTIDDFVATIIKHIDGALFLDRTTGKFHLKLVRDDYDIGSVVNLNPSNIAKVDNFGRPNTGELTNSVTVKYWDSVTGKDASVTVQDIALVQMQQGTIGITVDYPGFTNPTIATRVAERDLTTLSVPLISCTIYANAAAKDLNIGSVFSWTWPDYEVEDLPMRVVGIAFGDGKNNQVRLTCTQDIYKLPASAIVIVDAPVLPTTTEAPQAATRRAAFELPYLEAVQQNGQTAVDAILNTDPEVGYVGVAVGRPTNGHITASMYTNAGAGYALEDSLEFSPTALLAADLDKATTIFAISDPKEILNAANGTWFTLGDEIMVKMGYAAPNLTVKRGALDTVPQEHTVDDVLVFWDAFAGIDFTSYSDGESVAIKVTTTTTRGELAIALAPVDTVELAGRMYRPYPPGQFKINTDYYPGAVYGAITVSWVHRDRLLQTGGAYLGMLDAGVGPEPGTTYTVRIYDEDATTLLNTESGITGTSSTPYTPSVDANIKVELEAERDGVVSFQIHIHIFAWSGTPPDTRITEASDRRITEVGDVRAVD